MDSISQLGEQAPMFSLLDFEGSEWRLQDARGQIVVLNFWSAECPWSARADELLSDQLAIWGDSVIYIPIASNVNESVEEIKTAATERKLNLVLCDHNLHVCDHYGAFTTPHFFVLDQDGILRYRGAFDDATFRQRSPTQQYLIDAVEALLANRLPEPSETPGYGCTIVRYPMEGDR